VIVSGGDDGTVRVWAADGKSATISLGAAVYSIEVATSSLIVGGAFGLASLKITAEAERPRTSAELP
jgi:hypothetical protein